MKAKVTSEMEQARLDIERKLIPQGPNVVRHLSLPNEGKSLEWILEEMNRMDEEHGHSDYKVGKLSGAVYRSSLLSHVSWQLYSKLKFIQMEVTTLKRSLWKHTNAIVSPTHCIPTFSPLSVKWRLRLSQCA